MSKIQFTQEQQQLLRNNPYTARVTADSLSLSKEFKELFYKEYQSGSLPGEILRKYGYPAEVLGNRRIVGISYCIRKQFERNGEFRDARTSRADKLAVSSDEKLKRLEHQVNYLTQEVEFLKKISSIRNTAK